MRIPYPILFLLVGSLFLHGCKSTEGLKVMDDPNLFVDNQSTPYQEPDLNEFLSLFEESPQNEEVERNFVEGCTQMMRGNYDEALVLFNKVLEEDPDNHPAQYNSARIYHEQKDYARAVEFAQKALDGQSDNYWYYRFLVRALSSDGNIKRAIEVQAAMVDQFPDKVSDKMDLAELHFKSGNPDNGLKMLNQIEH